MSNNAEISSLLRRTLPHLTARLRDLEAAYSREYGAMERLGVSERIQTLRDLMSSIVSELPETPAK